MSSRPGCMRLERGSYHLAVDGTHVTNVDKILETCHCHELKRCLLFQELGGRPVHNQWQTDPGAFGSDSWVKIFRLSFWDC